MRHFYIDTRFNTADDHEPFENLQSNSNDKTILSL